MRTHPDCFPCFFRQANIALSHVDIGDAGIIDIMRGLASMLPELDFSRSPAHVTTRLHRFIRQKVGRDPFLDIKREYNERALALYPELKKMAERADDPLYAALRLAIAGNIIDFGIFTSVDMEGTIEKVLDRELAVDDYHLFEQDLERSSRVLYLLDNAGEIVFDRLLVEAIMQRGVEVTAVVKGGPVLNDAMMADAGQVGLDRICSVIDNGSDAVGTILEMCSEDFLRAFRGAELIISKGQANFETLMNSDEMPVYFLFQSKCSVVSRCLGLEKGSMILSKGAVQWKSGV